MSSPADLLDAAPDPNHADAAVLAAWMAGVEGSFTDEPEAWVELATGPELTENRSWALLSWPENAATLVVREPRASTVTSSAFALSLLEESPLDQRDVQVVAMLLHRSADLAGLDYPAAVRDGCARAGRLGESCAQWLPTNPASTPSTHRESGEGATFSFQRRPSRIDTDALEQWAGRRGAGR